jgi:GDP-L-fucose synthase
MKKILVTGSDGLVGNALRQLKPKNTYFASRKDANLTDFDETKKLFRKVKPTHVIHLAAKVGGIGGNMVHSGEYFRDNILINLNVLECARLSGVNKLISFMSTCVFPDKTSYPLNVKNIQDGPPHQSNFGYAYAKRMLQVQSDAYRKEWGCNYIIVMPTNIYGPCDNWSIKDGHVIPSLIHKIYLAKLNKEPLHVWGTGKPLREFIFSEDVAKLSLWALEEYNEELPIIISSSEEISIKKLVRLLTRLMRFDGRVIFDLDKPDGQYRKPSDTKKLREYIPNMKLVELEKGLKITVDWFLRNYPNIRNYDK